MRHFSNFVKSLGLFIAFAPLLTITAKAATYYIAPDKNPNGTTNTLGNDSNPGTQTSPWKTFVRAWQTVKPGDTLNLQDGTFLQSLHPTIDGQLNTLDQPPTFDINDYHKFPLDDPLRTKYFITIKALNDGKAIIDGDTNGDGTPDVIPVFLGSRCPYYTCGPEPQSGDGFIIQGIIARNSPYSVYFIQGQNVIIRRSSGYEGNTHNNSYVFHITSEWTDRHVSISDPANILLEDDVAGGSGRKMFVNLQKSGNIVFRRLFAAWQEWKGDDSGGLTCCAEWPWGDGIENYIWGDINNPADPYNQLDLTNYPNMLGDMIVENSIVYGMIPEYGFSLSPNSYGPVLFNRFNGDMSINVGDKWNGSLMSWPCPYPYNSQKYCRDFSVPAHRTGFFVGAYNNPTLKHNSYTDNFSYGSAGVSVSAGPWASGSIDNSISHMTLAKNAIDSKFWWTGTGIFPADLARFDSVTNLYIEGNSSYSDKSKGARLRYRYVNAVLKDGSDGTPAQELWPWPMESRIKSELGIYMSNYLSINPELNNFSVTNAVVPLINQYTAQQVNLSATPAPTPIPSGGKPGDVNGDGSVNILDIGIIIDNYGKLPVTNTSADLNHDGAVNILDIGIVVDNYGK